MRFIHTADWHLGRSFYSTSLVEDQAYVLDQLISLARDSKPDLILISGDVYDRAVPPTDAVKLLDDTLSRLILDIGVPTILIAGNHDSPQRLQFGARLMESLRLYIFAAMSTQLNFHQFYDEEGPVAFYAMPYAEPSIVRQYWADKPIDRHQDVITAWTALIRRNHPSGARSVLVAHAFVSGGEQSESERPLSVGGSDSVAANCFDGFDYVALGHLHRRQTLGNGKIHYSGSLLKYSFSEATHLKAVNIVELGAAGHCKIESALLTPKRDLRCIEGTLDNLLNRSGDHGSREDFIRATLLDKGALLDPLRRLREVYPNIITERPFLAKESGIEGGGRDHRKMDVVSLFGDFFSQVTGEPLSDEQRSVFAVVVDNLRQEEREV